MNHEEKGPAARPPTDSEEPGPCGDRYDCDATHARVLKLEAALREARRWVSFYRGTGDEHIDATLLRIDDALGEARGTASASEPLDKTQNSEQGAPEGASADDEPDLRLQLAELAGIPRRACGWLWTPAEKAIQGAVDVVEKAGAHPLLTAAVTLLGKARDAVADFVDLSPGVHSGTAPTAPLSPETAPPAPDLLRENRCDVCGREALGEQDPLREGACWRNARRWTPTNPVYEAECYRLGYERLLRENARLREDEERLKQQVQLIAQNAGERFADYAEQLARADKAEAELTRARAAHLENATLLEKANETVEYLEHIWHSPPHLIAKCQTCRDGDPRDRKGNAAQPPLNPVGAMKHKDNCPWGPVYNECTCDSPAAPAKEGK